MSHTIYPRLSHKSFKSSPLAWSQPVSRTVPVKRSQWAAKPSVRFGTGEKPSIWTRLVGFIKNLVRGLLHRLFPSRIVRPTLWLQDVTKIDHQWLKDNGIQGLMFDLDDTLIPWNKGNLDDAVSEKLKALQADGFQCMVVSNNFLKGYVNDMEKKLGIPVIGHARKPRPDGFNRALEKMKLQPHQVVIVGDRPLTDILGGNRLGIKTILVDSINKKENIIRRFLRGLENLMVVAPGT